MYNPLNQNEKAVLLEKQTEAPFTGEYDNFYRQGVYICRQCSSPLFSSEAKFKSGCGWPSFDIDYPGAVTQVPDKDGSRTEIICSNCQGHLGHVFTGEGFTDKNTRHCVNSVSLKFIPEKATDSIETVYLGGGCFWCTEAVFKMAQGVQSVTSGYAGGNTENPTYHQVSTGNTGHAEVIKVVFDDTQISFETILDLFFAAHDPTTLNRQGNDVGTQYRSIILYTTLDQKREAEKFIKVLQETTQYQDKRIVTEIVPLVKFYEAEDYHQEYYKNNSQAPYCQVVIKPKLDKIKKKLEDK